MIDFKEFKFIKKYLLILLYLFKNFIGCAFRMIMFMYRFIIYKFKR